MLAPPPPPPPTSKAAGEKSERNDFLLVFGQKLVALLFCVDGERSTAVKAPRDRTSSFDGESDFDDEGPFVRRVDVDVDTDDDDDGAEPSAGATPRRGDDEEAAVSVASAVRAARAMSDGRPVEFDGVVHSPPSSPCIDDRRGDPRANAG